MSVESVAPATARGSTKRRIWTNPRHPDWPDMLREARIRGVNPWPEQTRVDGLLYTELSEPENEQDSSAS